MKKFFNRHNSLISIIEIVFFLIVPIVIVISITNISYSSKIFKQRREIREIYQYINNNIEEVFENIEQPDYFMEKHFNTKFNPWKKKYIIKREDNKIKIYGMGKRYSDLDENDIKYDQEFIIIDIGMYLKEQQNE